MSKLAPSDTFFDLSDYGRTPGNLLANSLKTPDSHPFMSPLLFGICGLIAIYFILEVATT
jgi:hypothetical protein